MPPHERIQSSHAPRGPHVRWLPPTQRAEIHAWLEEKLAGENVSIHEVATFGAQHEFIGATLVRAAAAATHGGVKTAPTLRHAVALMGVRKSLQIFVRLTGFQATSRSIQR